MKIRFESTFEKYLKKIKDNKIFQRLKYIIEAIRELGEPFSMPNLKKMRGYDTFYRIRTGDYRIGIEIIDDEVIFTRILHRKDIYKFGSG
jgi:mRNA interferase RelE/StbE